MKNSVILTLAALLLCGCAKDDETTFVFHNDYFWFNGTKAPCQPIPDRWFVIYKAADSARILSEFERLGFTYENHRVYVEDKWIDEYPEELHDCNQMTVTAGYDPADAVEGIVSSGNLYLLPPDKKEWGKSNNITAVVDNEAQLELLKEYSKSLRVFITDTIRFDSFIGVFLVCTNRSAGDYVQVANWLHETGKFRSVESRFEKSYYLYLDTKQITP